ncbi:hypothetical protein ACHAXT_013186 [Thalassiosira profunda]
MTAPSAATEPSLTLSVVRLGGSQVGRPLEEIVAHVLADASCCTPAEAVARLKSNSPTTSDRRATSNTALRAKVEKSILRFRRDQDRWTSLTSLLLKSLAFYRSLDPGHGILLADNETDGNQHPLANKLDVTSGRLAIVDLPRTEHHRPFLPKRNKGGYRFPLSNKKETENCHAAMNVTHQYPWVCMAQQQLDPTATVTKLGVDVVVFSANLNEYSPTVDDFLKCFKSSCTPWEWERIHQYKPSKSCAPGDRSEGSKLQEFYLRWSMKEAYTKAMGLGMHINFDEFETSLSGIDFGADADVGEDTEEGIWSAIAREGRDLDKTPEVNLQRQFSAMGKVKKKKAGDWEYWEFIFVPLREETDGGGNVEANRVSARDSGYDACACICRGPLGQEEALGEDTRWIPARIERLTLVDLIRIHCQDTI